jgi:hypothetical protein
MPAPRHERVVPLHPDRRPAPRESGPADSLHTVAPLPRVAVVIPCLNEEAAIAKVVADFRAYLPNATVYVYDNGSVDRTGAVARAAGALVRHERLRGKGHVVRRMFADIEADVFVLVDGDDTYDAAAAPAMVEMLLENHLDMVNSARVSQAPLAYRRGHHTGNALLTGLVRWIFGKRVTDVLSGYRAFSRRFVKSFPGFAGGFETETEFTVHALELMMPIGELPSAYRIRHSGTMSKLRTWTDGLRILRTIAVLVKQERPLQLFGTVGGLLLLFGLGLGVPLVFEFARTGLVPRLPTAVLATGLVVLSFLSFVCGLVLDSVARGRREVKRLAYLAIPAIAAQP